MKPYSTLFKATLVGALLVLSSSLIAQFPRKSFGKFDKSWLTQTVFEPDTDAVAVVIHEWGQAEIEVNATSGIRTIYAVHYQIKILKEEGLRYADESLYYSDRNHARSSITKIEGQTFNLSPDGKMVETSLSKKMIFDEEVEDGIFVKKFSFPQAKVGSIIELRYVLGIEDIDIPDWSFQRGIPVVYSEFVTRIPQWFKFVSLKKGNMPIGIPEKEGYSESVIFTERGRQVGALTSGQNGRTQATSQTVNFEGDITHYVLEDVPALIKEPYITTMDDYRNAISFQLAGVQYPNSPYEPIITTWEDLTEEWYQNTSICAPLNKIGMVKSWVKDLGIEEDDELKRAEMVYDAVLDRFSCNGRFLCYTADPMDKVFRENTTNSGRLNMILVGAMRAAGLEAHPVLISTRGHGAPQATYPIMAQFNHVLCIVKAGEDYMLLDATDKYIPFGMLPNYSLNGIGFLLLKDNPQWIDIIPNFAYIKKVSGVVKVSPEGVVSGSMVMNNHQAAAARMRDNYIGHGGSKSDFVRTYLFDDQAEVHISEVTITDEGPAKPMKIRTEFESDAYVDPIGDYLYFRPLLDQGFAENPFRLQQRDYPVDFARPQQWEIRISIQLPEGYAVESLPESIQMVLPSQGAGFTYQVQAMGSMVQVVSRLTINQRTFEPAEYPDLRMLFNEVVSKQTDQIVLKKES